MVPSIPVFRNDVGNNLYIICELEKVCSICINFVKTRPNNFWQLFVSMILDNYVTYIMPYQASQPPLQQPHCPLKMHA